MRDYDLRDREAALALATDLADDRLAVALPAGCGAGVFSFAFVAVASFVAFAFGDGSFFFAFGGVFAVFAEAVFLETVFAADFFAASARGFFLEVAGFFSKRSSR